MDYLLGEVLYTGAETRVVAGVHRASQVPVVLKMPRHELPSERIVERIRREHALLRELDLPGLIRPLDLVPYGASVALVLERWGVSSLDRLVARGPLPVEAVLCLGAALARMLGQIHRKGVIHRDIKPQNVLVDAACKEVRLIDFGLSTRRTEVLSATNEGALSGTLAYIAPEQTGRMKRSVDARADLYALGGTLYQMLTGQLPFELTDELELIHAHIARRPAPPHERAPSLKIPEVVSAMVMMLLEKSPEERYQTADGLACDLEHALGEWHEAGAITPFALGARDWEDRIRRPSRFFGREREQRTLAEAFASARSGETRLVLVSGPSGVGKSVLVGALREEVLLCGGLFASGKFDLLQRGTPYAAIAQAFRALVRKRLSDSAEELARWEQTWRAALGPNVRILVDLAPELARILGEPPALLEVGPAEAKNRFELTVQRFVQATASAEHPLVLFIDDLQWADAPSLALIEAIGTDPAMKCLLVLGAYRDNEVDDAHPLHALIEAIAVSGRLTEVPTLGPLDDQALVDMVGDMLLGAGDEARGLCALVKAKTDGSPFFVEQFLRALHEGRLLSRDLSTGSWRWEAESVERATVTDNVVVLLTDKMGRLPAELRQILAVSACVGASFEARLVSAAAELAEETLRRITDALVQEGLLVRGGEAESENYAFVHDRVQQAAYELFGEEEHLYVHLALARELDRSWSAHGGDAELFALLYHYLQAFARLDDAAERRRVAQRCLMGGQRAKAASAYAEAARFLRKGREMLSEPVGEDSAELAFELDLALAEASFLAGQTEGGNALFAACREKAKDELTRARVAQVQVPLLSLAGLYPEGLAVGLAALEELGWPFPRDPEARDAFFLAQVERLSPRIAAMSADAYRALPSCTDPAARAAADVLSGAITPASIHDPPVSACMMLALLESAFLHGLSPHSAYGMAISAVVFAGVLQELALGARCVELAFASRNISGMRLTSAIFMAGYAGHFVCPDHALIHAQWRDLPEIGRREGNISYAEFSEIVPLGARMGDGARLSACTIPEKPCKDRLVSEIAMSFRAVHRLLSQVDVEDGKEAVGRVATLPTTSEAGRIYVLICGAFTAVHLGEDREALRLAIEADSLWMVGWSNPTTLWIIKLVTLLSATLPFAGGEDASARHKAFAAQRARLEKLAAFNPAIFRHAMLLVEAGEARTAGQHEKAERLYDEAIEHAARQGFVNDEALALRLCGEYLLSRGRERMARAYLRDAHDAYLRWEATAAAAVLRRKYPDVFPAAPAPEPEGALARRTKTRSMTITTGRATSQIDGVSLLKAAQALAGDRDPDSLIARMLRLLTENAGAERAVLVLARDGQLVVRAELCVAPERLMLHPSEPALDPALLPATVVHYVARSHEPLVLGRDGLEGRFEDDPYLKRHRPASMLLVPLLHQGRLLGVMVLVHSRAADAFPEARVEVVTLLAAQAATAVENAVLYTELERSHQRLEQLVDERTAELQAAKEAADAASHAKSDFLASMSHELRASLNAVLGYAQILVRATDLPPKHHNAVQVIRISGEHLLHLINDVLDLAKIEAGKLELMPGPVCFPTLLRTVLGICQVRAKDKGLSFGIEQQGIELETVFADQKRLTQVLLNLLGNAIKFTERGKVLLRVAAGEALPDGSRQVRFLVEDTGPGIAPEHIATIFEPFEQVGAARARAEGTGLGLSICKRIVTLMGGSIVVESKLGVGSVFEVEVPLVEVGAAPENRDAHPWERVVGYEGPRRALLVVDDRADNRAVVRDLLTPLGFRVLEASGGEQAIELSLAQRPDVILMDLAMPGMDGLEATRRLRQLPELACVPIIAWSSSASASERERSASAGCHDFLPKPIEAGALLDKIEAQLGAVWICATSPSPLGAPALAGADRVAGVMFPCARDLDRLLDLANRGRVNQLLQALEQLQQEDARNGPFVAEVRAIAKSFQVDRLCHFLRTAARADVAPS